MNPFPSLTIRAGSQTGVDRAALDTAIRLGLPYTGWCPKGGWAEDRPVAPGVRKDYPFLSETPSDRAQQRTAWNVRDAHATLILTVGDDLTPFGGSEFGYIMARLVFLKPCLVNDIRSPADPAEVRDWIAHTAAGIGVNEMVLNIAGPRESEVKGAYVAASRFLTSALQAR